MISEKILEIFPPPEFLNFPYVGISLSDDFVRCVKFREKNGSLSLEKYREIPLPRGVVSSGLINRADELAEILKVLKKELNIKYARVSLPEEKAYLFTTHIPLVQKKELRSTIEFKLEENVPLPAQEVVFDYIVTNPVDYKDNLEVVVSAIPYRIVETYLETVQKAGITVLSLETKSQAIARAILPKSKKGTFIVVHFSPEKTGLYVVSDNIVHFTSTILLEGALQDKPEFISKEIMKLEAYWYDTKVCGDKSEMQIEGIIVCGDNFSDSVVPHLSAHHKMPVRLGNVWENVFDLKNSVPPIPFTESLRYAPAIGLALPSEVLI